MFFEAELKNKLLAPKWDSFQKHVNCRKVDKLMRGESIIGILARIVRIIEIVCVQREGIYFVTNC
jgi:hypothetical protein